MTFSTAINTAMCSVMQSAQNKEKERAVLREKKTLIKSGITRNVKKDKIA